MARLLEREFVRYVLNGLFATAAHFAMLTFLLQVLAWQSAGLANLCAAVVGIATSFLGSRYFVFRQVLQPFSGQVLRFGSLYAAIAVLHGLVLFIWSDWLALPYTIGFLLATGLQFMLSYLGNKYLVFHT